MIKVKLWLISRNCLSHHHLYDPDHTTPSNIFDLAVGQASIGEPDNLFKSIIEIVSRIVVEHFTEQIGSISFLAEGKRNSRGKW